MTTTTIKARDLRVGDYLYVLDDQHLVEYEFEVADRYLNMFGDLVVWAPEEDVTHGPVIFKADDDVLVDER